MANLDEPGGALAANQNGTPDPVTSGGVEQRVNELERENAKLRAELAEARADLQSLWRTLRTVAPEYMVSEAEMREVMEHPVQLRDALAEAERMLGAGHDR
jgi:hypothetical protein